MAKVGPETEETSMASGHDSSFNLHGLTGKDGKFD